MVPDPAERPCISADEAFAELGIDRTTGYRAIREGTFPIPVIRVGRLIRVPTLALRRLLETGSVPPVPPVPPGYDDPELATSLGSRALTPATRPTAHRAALPEERLEAREA
jgi:predicted DNA-binding transcriptional regulator AlpA